MRLAWVPVLAFAALVLGAAPASACSLAGPVAGPGLLVIDDPSTGESWQVRVEGRTLGAGCELSNRHALRGDAFAWFEVDEERAGAQRHLHVRELASGTERVFSGITRSSIESMTLLDKRVVYVERDDSGAEARTRVVEVDLATGKTSPVDVDVAPRTRVLVEGPLLVATEHRDTGNRLSVWHLDDERWVLRDAAFTSMGLPSEAWVALAGEHWLLLGRDQAHWLYDIDARSAERFDVPRRGFPIAIDGDALVLSTHPGLARVSLPDGGESTPWIANAPQVVSVQEGRIVRGIYSAPDADGGSPIEVLGVPPKEVPAPPPLMVGLLLAGLASWRRLRSRPPRAPA